jgi:hypothetical protein
MVPLRLTNLLGSIIGSNEVSYDPYKQSMETHVPKEIFYRWEAQLAQCAYLSRLVYSPSEIFLRGIRFLDYAPDVMNDIITQLEHSLLSRASFSSLFLSSAPVNASTVRGQFFPRTGCAIFQHHSPTSNINNAPTLYVVFKGSSSLRDFMNDLKIVKTPFSEIPELTGLSGTAHGGFYKHMRDEVAQILVAVESLSVGMDRIVITGHSLGGAMSTLFSLMLALKKRNGTALPALHCVTFGAPNLFSDDARNVYNSFLTDGTLTLDRVTAESKGLSGGLLKTFAGPSAIDVIIMMPGVFFSHPGFNILKTEMYATSHTGRAKDIDDIRSLFLGRSAVIKRKGAGPHELPADPVFWNLFQPLPTDADITLDMRLQNYGQMKRYLNPEFVKFVLQDLPITRADIQPTTTKAEDDALESSETALMKKEVTELVSAVGNQHGGALTFATTAAAANYKTQTLQQFPNRVNYQCYKRLSAGFCHAAYMGIGFLSAVRVPVLRYRDDAGKLHTKFVRKLEPTIITKFVAVGNDLTPTERYYAVPMSAPHQGGKTRRRSRALRKTRKRKNM